MWRKVLALIGLLIFISGIVFLTIEVTRQQAGIDEAAVTLVQQGIFERRAAIVAGIGLLLGPILTVPWWIKYFRKESKWYEKRDESLDGPPRVPN